MPKANPALADGLYQLSFLLQDRLAALAAAHKVTIIQMRLLGILRDREPGMNELADQLRLEKSSLSGLVDRAAKGGLVERVASKADGRVTTVKLTARGAKLMRVFGEQIGAEVAKLVDLLPDAEQKRLTALVEKIVAPETPPVPAPKR